MKRIVALLIAGGLCVLTAPAQARQDPGTIDPTARPGVWCPNILQMANALRLATPAQAAAYRERLPHECQTKVALEAALILRSGGTFAMRDGQVWLPAMQDPGGGNSGVMEHGLDTRGSDFGMDFDRALRDVGQGLQAVGGIAAAVSAAMGSTLGGRWAGAAIAVGAALNAFGNDVGFGGGKASGNSGGNGNGNGGANAGGEREGGGSAGDHGAQGGW